MQPLFPGKQKNPSFKIIITPLILSDAEVDRVLLRDSSSSLSWRCDNGIGCHQAGSDRAHLYTLMLVFINN